MSPILLYAASRKFSEVAVQWGVKYTILFCAASGLALSMFSPIAASAQSSSAETLQSVLAKHLKADGGAAAQSDQSSMKIVYAISGLGMTGTLTEYDKPPKQSRVEMSFGPISQTMVDNGTVSWQQDNTGNVRVLRGEELAENRADSDTGLESYDPLKDHKKANVRLLPKRDPATGDFVINFQPVGGNLQTIYLDPKTFLVSKIIQHKSGMTGSVVIQSYTTKYGAKIPSRLVIGYAGLPVKITADLQSLEKDVTIADTMFTLPEEAKDFHFLTPTGQGPATFNFVSQDNEIILPLTINGQPHRLMLDSGAAGSFLTGAAARSLKLNLKGNFPALGYGGVAKSGIAASVKVELPGAVSLNGLTLRVIDDPSVTQALSAKAGVDGALGYDLFTRFVVTIDYPHKTLTLSDPDTYQPPTLTPGRDVILPLKLQLQTPTVRAAVDGRKPASFLIDTGDSGGIHLFSQYAKSQGLMNNPNSPKAQVRVGAGVGGMVMEIITPGHSLQFGTIHVPSVSIATISSKGVTDASSNPGGIGNEVLSHFVVTFDYNHQRLILQSPAPVALALVPAYTSSLLHLASDDTAPKTTQEVLAKHLEALGGADAVNAITSTRVEGKVATGGLEGVVTSVYQSPENEYEDNKIGPIEQLEGYDGKTAWQQDSNGNVRPLGEDELRDLRNQLYFDTNSYVIPGRVHGTITLRPDREPVTGNYVLDALPEGGKKTTIFLDPTTFLIVKEQHNDDNVIVTTTFSDYFKSSGVEFPGKQVTTNGNTRYDLVVTTTKVENNVTVPASLFEPPNLAEKFTFVSPTAVSATVPFDIDFGEISLPATINGKSVRLLFDSGSGGIALSDDVAKELKLPETGYLEARGYGGSTDLHPVQISSLMIGSSVKVSDITAVAIPLGPGLNRQMGTQIAGFAGYDLLTHYVIRIDYAHHRMTFINPSKFVPKASDGKSLPIGLDNNVPTLIAKLDNLPSAQFLVDTGDAATLRLYQPYVAQYKLDKKYPGGMMMGGAGIAGSSPSRLVRTQLFTLAGVKLPNVPTEFSLDTKGGASQLQAGAIGFGILSQFTVTFDYKHGRIFFAPNSPVKITPAVKKGAKQHR